MKKKADLPTKICPVCQRPFAWRKKWERCWDEVKYCSDRCRQAKAIDVPTIVNPQIVNPQIVNPQIVNRKS
jgi:hypothetical protein